jgi:hypothetical protein
MVYYRQTLLTLLKCFEVNDNKEWNKSDIVNSKILYTYGIIVKNMLYLHTNIKIPWTSGTYKDIILFQTVTKQNHFKFLWTAEWEFQTYGSNLLSIMKLSHITIVKNAKKMQHKINPSFPYKYFVKTSFSVTYSKVQINKHL